MLTGRAEAVQEVIGVRRRELARILETGPVVINVVVLLYGLDNVALALELQELLSNHNVRVVHCDAEVADVALVLVEASGMTEGTLVVGDGPLGRGHDAQVMIPVGVQRVYKRIL